jgi:hypothetical protein
MKKPNLNTIIAENLEKDKFQSKTQPSLPKDGWLNAYTDGGQPCYECGGNMYKRGGGYFPEYHSWAPPRMQNGGDDISIPNLNKYGPGGNTNDCGPGFHKNAMGQCVLNPLTIPGNTRSSTESTSHSFYNPFLGIQSSTATADLSSAKPVIKRTAQPAQGKLKTINYDTRNNVIPYTDTKEYKQQAVLSSGAPIEEEGWRDFMYHKFKQDQTPETLGAKNTKYGNKIANVAKAVTAAGELVPVPIIRYPSMALNMALGADMAVDDYKNKDYGNMAMDISGMYPMALGKILKPLSGVHAIAPFITKGIDKIANLFSQGTDYTNNFRFQYKNGGGTYISDRAKATQFGQYKSGGWLDKYI